MRPMEDKNFFVIHKILTITLRQSRVDDGIQGINAQGCGFYIPDARLIAAKLQRCSAKSSGR
ncbi:hypothetical protein BFP70_08435 [Thioclava sp. SK-1]|nr:hypothetical protein BFP70_08435 [Thioclava sp. SK-1]